MSKKFRKLKIHNPFYIIYAKNKFSFTKFFPDYINIIEILES